MVVHGFFNKKETFLMDFLIKFKYCFLLIYEFYSLIF
jgi:hypothetical protein